MSKQKELFAKSDLTTAVRFNTALKITSRVFLHKKFNAPVILFAIMSAVEDYQKTSLRGRGLSSYQKNTMVGICFSNETCVEVVKFFTSTYHDDDMLVGWLNQLITDKSILRFKSKPKFSNEQSLEIAKDIVNNDLLSNLNLSL